MNIAHVCRVNLSVTDGHSTYLLKRCLFKTTLHLLTCDILTRTITRNIDYRFYLITKQNNDVAIDFISVCAKETNLQWRYVHTDT